MRNAKFWMAGLVLLLVAASLHAQTPGFTVGGSVAGLTGTGLVLQNNGADDLAIGGNIAFTFATPVTAYSVTVLNQPNNPPQSCGVQNGAGVASANVSAVVVSCGPPSVLAPMPPPANFDFSPLFDAVNQSTSFTVSTRTSIDTIGQRLYKDESDIAKLQSNGGGVGPAGPQGPQGIPGPIGPAGANGAAGASLAPQTLPSPHTYQFHMNTGGVTSNETLSTNGGVLFISGPAVGAKSFADYLIPVFQAGNYKVKFRMWVSTGSTPVKFHLECPVGTTVATFNYVPPSSSPNYVQTGDNNDVGTKLPFALPQGLQDMRLVIDSAGVGPSINWFDWMALTKQ